MTNGAKQTCRDPERRGTLLASRPGRPRGKKGDQCKNLIEKQFDRGGEQEESWNDHIVKKVLKKKKSPQ